MTTSVAAGRNEPCPCGSGQKYKRCCLAAATRERAEASRVANEIEEGYRLRRRGHGARARDAWSRAWTLFRDRLDPTMRTLDAARGIAGSRVVLRNWVHDQVDEFLHASFHDAAVAARGVELCEDVLARFPDESAEARIVLRADLAELHARAGHLDRAEQILAEVMRDAPESAIGHVYLAMILSGGTQWTGAPADVARARALLEDARHKPDADDFGVETRLEDLDAGGGEPHVCEHCGVHGEIEER